MASGYAGARTPAAAGGYRRLCWLALLLTRTIEVTCGDTWPDLRRELDRLKLDTSTSALPAMDKSVAGVVAGRILGAEEGGVHVPRHVGWTPLQCRWSRRSQWPMGTVAPKVFWSWPGRQVAALLLVEILRSPRARAPALGLARSLARQLAGRPAPPSARVGVSATAWRVTVVEECGMGAADILVRRVETALALPNRAQPLAKR